MKICESYTLSEGSGNCIKSIAYISKEKLSTHLTIMAATFKLSNIR